MDFLEGFSDLFEHNQVEHDDFYEHHILINNNELLNAVNQLLPVIPNMEQLIEIPQGVEEFVNDPNLDKSGNLEEENAFSAINKLFLGRISSFIGFLRSNIHIYRLQFELFYHRAEE